MNTLRITFSNGTVAEAQLDAEDTISVRTRRGNDGELTGSEFTRDFPLTKPGGVTAAKLEFVGDELGPRFHPSGQNPG